MSETKHTPGPWEWEDADTPEYCSINIRSASCGAVIGTVCNADDFPCAPEDQYERIDAEARANARLFIAAPDLLKACKAALGAFEHNHAIDWNDLERAIAKAEGREPARGSAGETRGEA